MNIILDFILKGHAFVGALALFSGFLALFFRKGGTKHKNWGVMFYWSLLLTAGTAIIISISPGHESPFLFMVAIFSGFFGYTGRRALMWRKKTDVTKLDKAVAFLLLFCGLAFIGITVFLHDEINFLWLSFGLASLFFSAKDFLNFKNEEKRQNFWLRIHVGRMVGAYISIVSAFLVVNSILPDLLNWYLPAFIGVPYIFYWTGKVKKSRRWTSGKYRKVKPIQSH